MHSVNKKNHSENISMSVCVKHASIVRFDDFSILSEFSIFKLRALFRLLPFQIEFVDGVEKRNHRPFVLNHIFTHL